MRAILALYLAGCSHWADPQAQKEQLGWLIGAWHDGQFDEQFVRVADVIWGVSLRDDGFEVTEIAGHTLTTLENGNDAVHLEMTMLEKDLVKFGELGLGRQGDHLVGTYREAKFDAVAAPAVRSPELEAADQRFAADSAARGAEAWVAVMGKGGALWRDKRVEGDDAIRETIGHTLEHGKLTWAPVASGVRGAWGFTVGTYKFNASSGTYCTIWKREDGGWKVAFDLGS